MSSVKKNFGGEQKGPRAVISLGRKAQQNGGNQADENWQTNESIGAPLSPAVGAPGVNRNQTQASNSLVKTRRRAVSNRSTGAVRRNQMQRRSGLAGVFAENQNGD
jgi:hypothetical protein